jgi:hypothetical protein
MPPSGIWCVSSRHAFSSANASTSTMRAVRPGRLHGRLALLDVLGARRDEQHVDQLGIFFGRSHDFEVEADFLHRERDVLSACISTCDSSSLSRSVRGIWMTFVIARRR